MRAILWGLIVTCLAAAGLAAQEHHHGSGALGTVNFQTSCDQPLQAEFNHAVALLHSFEYDEARDAFTALAKKDGDCAMAQWGIAMTHLHGLWGEIDVPKGRAAAAEAKRIAETYKKSAREKQYIEAITALYEGDDVLLNERLKKFAGKMTELHAAYPDDIEATIFYALALDESAPRSDKSYANQRKCGEILEPLLEKLPSHPGVAHYLIHCYDNEMLAPKGLEAARRYARIAPASSHAQHMPSHIFVRLGLWQETVDSNLGAMQAAEQDAAASQCERRGNTMHAMHFLQYAYLQEGKLKQARDVANGSRKLPAVSGDCQLSADFVAASFALDAHDWELARQLKPEHADRPIYESLTWVAIGIGSARSGDVKRAQEAESALEKARDEMAKRSPRGKGNAMEAYRLEVEAWIADAQGDHAKAADTMRAAAELDTELGYAAWVLPPAREMLGDLLLQQRQPQAALEAYRAVLKTEPRLFNPLNGAAAAAAMAGDAQASAEYRARLKEIAGGGDRPEVAQLGR